MARTEKVIMTNMCMVFSENRVLVQDKTDDDYSGITFPGGHVERGESFTDANDYDYDDGHTFEYYVGAKSKRISYPNACCIRKVVSLGDKLEYEEMLPLMAVDFVRNNQYTVLPFPYKYLREYIEGCNSF